MTMTVYLIAVLFGFLLNGINFKEYLLLTFLGAAFL